MGKPRQLTDQERNDRHKLRKQIASLQGQAGRALATADKLRKLAEYPYMAVRNRGHCGVCGQPLGPNGDFTVIPHTARTCPGREAGQVMQ